MASEATVSAFKKRNASCTTCSWLNGTSTTLHAYIAYAYLRFDSHTRTGDAARIRAKAFSRAPRNVELALALACRSQPVWKTAPERT